MESAPCPGSFVKDWMTQLPDSAPPAPVLRWRIGECVFDAAASRIERHGARADLDGRSSRLLACLAEADGKAVDKESLLAAGWPGQYVTENSLAKAIGRIRKALGGEEALQLRAEHSFGYSLQGASPLLAPAGKAPPASRLRVVWATAGLALILGAGLAWGLRARPQSGPSDKAAAPSIAVLPFEDLSPAQDQRFFAEGLSDHLSGILASVKGVKVASRTAVLPFRGRGGDPAAIGRALHVDTILDGSVQRDGPRLRITVQLINARTGLRIWSSRLDRAFTNLFDIQDEIARTILGHLRVELVPSQLSRGAPLHTSSPEAFERFLYAQHVYKDDESGGRRSLRALEEAVKLDPGFYEARVALADALGFTGFYADRAEEALAGKRRALAMVTQAIQLQPKLPEAWWLRADQKYALWWDWDGAAQDLAEGAKVGGTERMEYQLRLIRLKAALGHLEEAVELGRRASELDPADPTPLLVMGYHLIALGRFQEGERVLSQASSLDPTEEHISYYRGLGKLLQGKPRDALRHFEDSAYVFRLTGLAMAYHRLGEQKQSKEQLDLLRSRYAHIQPYQVASVHAFRGETDEAFAWLDRACQLHDASLMYLKWDPLLRNLHQDPRWQVLLQRVHLDKAGAGAPRGSGG